jgi:hypothetical protein
LLHYTPLCSTAARPALRAGAVFHTGKLLERHTDITPDTSTAEPQTAGSEVARINRSMGS